MHEPPPLFVKGYKVDEILFNMGYPGESGPYRCDSTCCSDGVWVDLGEKDKILKEKELVKKHMDDTQEKDETKWFAEYEEDSDFPSGSCVGTTVNGSSCVFLNNEGLCVLQLAAISENRTKWDMKPFYCVLFPISISDKTLTFDDHKQDKASCCSIYDNFNVPLYKACKEEIIYAVGEDGYQTIEDYYNAYKKHFTGIEV